MPDPTDDSTTIARARDGARAFFVVACLLLCVVIGTVAYGHVQRGGDDTPLNPAIRINVNTADAPTLQLLPGIGPVLAERVLADRAARGPYRDTDDLQRVKGIADRLASRMAPHVRFRD
ncbi:MAG: hypothetical protein GC159_05740 [Phycisphaera sp.]|nr:hypothetical protein [Phycisphaera sp.]